MSEDELLEIELRCRSTTPGPWTSFVEGRDHNSGSNFIMTGTEEVRGPDFESYGLSAADQDFVAHAKQDIPRLIAEVRRLKGLLE